MNKSNESRRDFIKKTAGVSAGLVVGGVLPGFSASSYKRILGANEMLRVSVMGVNSRGNALAKNFAFQENCEVIHICDVDSRATEKCIAAVEKVQNKKPAGFVDIRKSLENRDVDILVVAAPDHWHAPAALMALQAGKHVYLEKPCSHSPREGEILIEAVKKYGKSIQMGNQRRSYPNVVKGIEELKNGIIGRAYFGKGWYTNNRGPIGVGKTTPVPDWLNWDLWQGPAPRMEYKDNIVHYNWHWFWHWGTGEALNNGTHMIDLLRWGFDVDYPVKVSSNGGRFRYNDDWETPDTQVINLDFKEGVSMTWEGRSCNGKPIEGSSVGVIFYGEEGSLFIPGGDQYTVFDLDNKVVKEVKGSKEIDPRDAANPSSHMDALHIRNLFDNIRSGESLVADIDSGHKSTVLVQLGNIAQRVGHSLEINPGNGHIIGDKKAQKLWSRTYEKGWEMKL
ncbi:MAG: Gfo/Idh/MocA family oxidoreductase [Mariniphaga sp.]|jgi:predicted dehydrogenase